MDNDAYLYSVAGGTGRLTGKSLAALELGPLDGFMLLGLEIIQNRPVAMTIPHWANVYLVATIKYQKSRKSVNIVILVRKNFVPSFIMSAATFELVKLQTPDHDKKYIYQASRQQSLQEGSSSFDPFVAYRLLDRQA